MCTLVNHKVLLVLDEPTICLDKKGIESLIEFLNRIKEKSIILLCTHDKFDNLNNKDVTIINMEEYTK